MSTELIAAAGLLADTLTAENAALTALDLPRAAAMLADKQRAVTGFVAAMNAAAQHGAAGHDRAAGAAPAGALGGKPDAAGAGHRRAGPGDRRDRPGRLACRCAVGIFAPMAPRGHLARPTALALVARA